MCVYIKTRWVAKSDWVLAWKYCLSTYASRIHLRHRVPASSDLFLSGPFLHWLRHIAVPIFGVDIGEVSSHREGPVKIKFSDKFLKSWNLGIS